METIFKKGDRVKSLWYSTHGEIGVVVEARDTYCIISGFSDGDEIEINGETLHQYSFDNLELISKRNQEIEFYAKYL